MKNIQYFQSVFNRLELVRLGTDVYYATSVLYLTVNSNSILQFKN